MLRVEEVRDQRITHAQFRVYSALCLFANNAGECFPSLETLAEYLGMTRSTVTKHIRGLEGLGIVVRTERRDVKTGGQSSNLYFLPGRKELGNNRRGVSQDDKGGISLGDGEEGITQRYPNIPSEQTRGTNPDFNKNYQEDSKVHISLQTMEGISQIAPGWDKYYLEGQYLNWIEAEGIRPRNADNHFLQFVRTHVKKNLL